MGKELLNSDKELLLIDLCARLPYGVRMFEIEPVNNIQSNLTLLSITNKESVICITPSGGVIGSSIDAFKPYLFPLSSMTEEQREEFLNIQTEERQILLNALIEYKSGKYDKIPIIAPYKQIEWLNKNYFDYRGLIERGLAIDCTNLNVY